MADSTISLSTESFVEIGGSTHKTSASSASFVQLEEDGKDEDALEVGEGSGGDGGRGKDGGWATFCGVGRKRILVSAGEEISGKKQVFNV